MNLHIDNNRIEITTDKQIIVNGQEVKPAWDRQTCLAGLYHPPDGSSYFRCNPDGTITGPYTWEHYFAFGPNHRDGYRYLPTHEMAREFLTIGKAKWLPKKGDRVWSACLAKAGSPYTHRQWDNFISEQDYTANSDFAHFPSEAQRTAYLATLKPEVTVAYLEEQWDKAKSKVTSEYGQLDIDLWRSIRAFYKSRFAANLIRASEGPGDGRLHWLSIIDGEISRRNSSVMLQPIGSEVFKTDEGLRIYHDFMKDELQYL